MKNKLLWMLILLAQTFYAQEVTGSWKGEIDIQGTKIPIIFHIDKDKDSYKSTTDSPLQGVTGKPVDNTQFRNNELLLEIKSIGAIYKGKLEGKKINGTLSQSGMQLPLILEYYDNKPLKAASKKTITSSANISQNIGKIDDYLNYITKHQQGIGTISIFKDGKEFYQKNFGQEQLPNVKWDSKTAYQIGSVSKLVTAVMLMQQVEKGKLKLNDKLSKYYPDAPNSEKITIESIMNHTSGLGDYVGSWLFEKSVGDKAILDTIKKHGVEFQPGEKTRYSNSGYFLLSRILEKITNKPYNILLKENITGKAKMDNTFSVLDNPKNIFKSYENNTGKWTEVEDFDFHNCIGLGDITSTSNDMSLFINALFNYKFIKKETLEMMIPKTGKSFGLGMMTVPFYNKISYGHGGDTAGTHSLVSYSPTENYSVVTIINGEKMPHNDLTMGILNIIYDQDYEFPKFTETKKASEKEMEKLVGDYSSKDISLGLKIFVKDETLFAQGTGQPAFPLEYIGKNEFSFEKADVKMIFNPEKNQLNMTQAGKTAVFTKK